MDKGKKIAVCGLDCSECPAFIAHQNNDNELRVKTAGEWSKMYEHNFTPEDINCVGCVGAEGVQVGFCSVCETRACGLKNAVANCALCPDYACDRLIKFFATAPAAKKNLEEIRGKISVTG
jgi:hypothetical protein